MLEKVENEQKIIKLIHKTQNKIADPKTASIDPD